MSVGRITIEGCGRAMSPNSREQFNLWFPALLCGLVIGLIAAAVWDILRRKFWCCASRFWPGVLREVGLDASSTEVNLLSLSKMLSEVHTEVTKPRRIDPWKDVEWQLTDAQKLRHHNHDC